MGKLFANFMVYAGSVLAFLTSLKSKVQANYNELKGRLDTMDLTINGLTKQVNDRYTEFTAFVDSMPSKLTNNLNAAKSYADDLFANINLSIFAGRTGAQWESWITNKTAELLDSEAARVNAIKDTVWTKVVKLLDYQTNEIPYTTLGAPAVQLGNKTVYRLLIEAPLGATDTTRTITELPGAVTDVVVDAGDEIYVSYDVNGAGSYVVYNSNQASVIAAVMAENEALRTDLAAVKAEETKLANAFESEAAKIDALAVGL